MTTALSVTGIIAAAGLAEIGGVIVSVLYYTALVVGSLTMLCGVLFFLFLTVTAPPRKPRHAPTQPSLVIEVGDDTMAMLRGEMSDAAIEQWLGEGGRNG